eukprot:2562362-Pyramimonas_sp.AAC.1
MCCSAGISINWTRRQGQPFNRKEIRTGCHGGPRTAYLLGSAWRRRSAGKDRVDRVQTRGESRRV